MKTLLKILYVIIMVMVGTQVVHAQPPANDTCAGAQAINLNALNGPVYFTMDAATTDTAPMCAGVSSGASGVWFRFVGTGLTYTFSVCNNPNQNNTRIRIFAGTCQSLTCVAGDNGSCGTRARATLQTQPGTQYYLLVSHATGAALGLANLGITEVTVPGSVGANQWACYGGTTLPVTATGYPGTIVKWQKRLVNGEWEDIALTEPTFQPGTLFGTTRFRVIIDAGSGLFPVATPAVVTVNNTLGVMPAEGTCTCRVRLEQTDWGVFFQEEYDLMFFMTNPTQEVDMGVVQTAAITYPTIPTSPSYRFLPRSFVVEPEKEGNEVDLWLVFAQAEFDALQASNPAYAGKTIEDLSVVWFDDTLATPHDYGVVLPSIVPLFEVYGQSNVRAAIIRTSVFGRFFLTLDSYGVSPLPITLQSFTATCMDGTVRVDWTTASEINNEQFVIEKSANLQDWEQVTTVQGAGNSNQPLSYSVVDDRPLEGYSYYRLTQYDYDGTTESFQPVVVWCEATELQPLVVYPNPTEGLITVTNIPSGVVTVTDMHGKVVYSTTITSPEAVIDIHHCADGLYAVSSGQSVVKVVLAK